MSSNPLEIDCRSVKTKLDNGEDILFVDCREKAEHDTVHIKEAILIPMSEMQGRIAELEAYKNRPIIIHCHHGGRSLRVTQWLIQQGFTDTRSMAGGIDEWATAIDTSLPRY